MIAKENKHILAVFLAVAAAVCIALLLGRVIGSPQPFSGYPYRVESGSDVCWMNSDEHGRWLANRELNARGISTYEVVEGDRCVNK